jgi:carboxyl-terminal processing protease
MATPAGRVLADGPQPSSASPVPAPAIPPDLARRVQAVADAVLENHVDPPARQQMVLSAIKAVYRAAGSADPLGLGRRVSAMTTVVQLEALLKDVWPKTTARPVAAQQLEEALFEGLLAVVPGGAELMTAKEARVAEQMAGNRYVGLQIALSMDEKEKLPVMASIFPGGPASRAGIEAGTFIEEIDGAATKGMSLREVVDRLRGDEGSTVKLKLRHPKDAASRTLTLSREALARTTITGIGAQPTGDWKLRLDGPDPIGYLRVVELTASTPHELRKLARRMEDAGIRALVLDLRGLQGSSAHPAMLLADSLLDRGAIGRVRTARGETTYRADADVLFRGWPIAVLVDPLTAGPAEWLAAALQDNHRAVIVGRPTRGSRAPARRGPVFPIRRDHTAAAIHDADAAGLGEAFIKTTVPVGDGSMSLSLVTGILERGDGRPLDGHGVAVAFQPPDPAGPIGGVQPDRPVPAAPVPLLRRNRPPGAAPAASEAGENLLQDNNVFINEALAVLHKALQTP